MTTPNSSNYNQESIYSQNNDYLLKNVTMSEDWIIFVKSAENYSFHTSAILCLTYSHYFDIWWNPDKFSWSESSLLAVCCFEYFTKWWNPKKFQFNKSSAESLMKYCSKYKDIWEPYYISSMFKKSERY